MWLSCLRVFFVDENVAIERKVLEKVKINDKTIAEKFLLLILKDFKKRFNCMRSLYVASIKKTKTSLQVLHNSLYFQIRAFQ